jgi:hypothetical protein
MRPIDFKIDSSLTQALTCGEYRFPKAGSMSPLSYDLSVSLRFALLGIAACHFALKDCPPQEQDEHFPELRFFGTMIREHLDQERVLCVSIPPTFSNDSLELAQATFAEIFDRYVELRTFRCPLDLAMNIIVEEFTERSKPYLKSKYRFWGSKKGLQAFQIESEKSHRFALNFYERRHYELEELPEIALIGE